MRLRVEEKVRSRERQSADDRRRQILGEAVRLIGERGYYGFGLRELGQRCGLGNAGLLHHFGSKEGLLIALLEDRDARDVESNGFSRFDAESPDACTLKDVRDVLQAAVARNCHQPELIRLYAILQAEALNEDHPAFGFFRTRELAFIESLESLVSRHVPEPRSTARQLLALMLGLEQQWLRSGHEFDLVVEWERSVALILPD